MEGGYLSIEYLQKAFSSQTAFERFSDYRIPVGRLLFVESMKYQFIENKISIIEQGHLDIYDQS